MSLREVDVAIIGAGTAGLAAYRAAREYTSNLVLIEGGEHGTTCARVGCMPSKLLIAAADAASHHKHTELFGVESQAPIVHGERVMARVRAERDRFVGFVVESVNDFPEEHKVQGYARFVDDNILELSNGERIRAKRIVIATGSRPNILPFLKKAGSRLLVNDDVFELEMLPTSLAVFGPGVIGLELGQAFSRLGVSVSVFGVGGSLGPLQDEEINEYALKQFNNDFYLDTDAKVHQISKSDEGVTIEYDHRDKARISDQFDYVLAATGRTPNLDNIGLENTSLALSDRGAPSFDRYSMQIENSHIFIAGDANNDIPLLHEAADEGRIAGDNAGRSLINEKDIPAGKRRANIGVVFTEPQIATVGLSLKAVKERCQECYATGEVSFEDQGRSRVVGKNVGLLKVYGEQGSGLFLGAEMFGPAAEHIAHLLSWSVQQRLTVSQMLEMPFYHPVIEEGVRTALRDLNSKLHLGPEMVERCLDCGPGA